MLLFFSLTKIEFANHTLTGKDSIKTVTKATVTSFLFLDKLDILSSESGCYPNSILGSTYNGSKNVL